MEQILVDVLSYSFTISKGKDFEQTNEFQKYLHRLRAIFRENRKSHDTREKTNFFSFRQNIPFSNLIEEKIILGSSDSLYGRNYKKFEKSIFFRFFVLRTTESDRNFEKTVNA